MGYVGTHADAWRVQFGAPRRKRVPEDVFETGINELA